MTAPHGPQTRMWWLFLCHYMWTVTIQDKPMPVLTYFVHFTEEERVISPCLQLCH